MRLLHDELGATATEYALVAAGSAFAAVGRDTTGYSGQAAVGDNGAAAGISVVVSWMKDT